MAYQLYYEISRSIELFLDLSSVLLGYARAVKTVFVLWNTFYDFSYLYSLKVFPGLNVIMFAGQPKTKTIPSQSHYSFVLNFSRDIDKFTTI